MTERNYLSTREVAKLLRGKLRETFPGVKFSVRCDRGTASAWIQVAWVDGPLEDAVRQLCDPWKGADFDGMQDMSVPRDALLVSLKPGELPVPVRPIVDGIIYQHSASLERLLAAQETVRRYLPTFTAYEPDGRQGPDSGRWLDTPGAIFNRIRRAPGETTGYGLVQLIALHDSDPA